MSEIGNAVRQETGRWLKNWAESSHQPMRRRERAMQRFRYKRSLQKFAAIHSSVHNHFNRERHLYSRNTLAEPIRRPCRMAPARRSLIVHRHW
jgi:putative transposase